MTQQIAKYPRRRATIPGGWRVEDLALSTGFALAIAQHESPVLGVIPGGIDDASPRPGGRTALHLATPETPEWHEHQRPHPPNAVAAAKR